MFSFLKEKKDWFSKTKPSVSRFTPKVKGVTLFGASSSSHQNWSNLSLSTAIDENPKTSHRFDFNYSEKVVALMTQSPSPFLESEKTKPLKAPKSPPQTPRSFSTYKQHNQATNDIKSVHRDFSYLKGPIDKTSRANNDLNSTNLLEESQRNRNYSSFPNQHRHKPLINANRASKRSTLSTFFENQLQKNGSNLATSAIPISSSIRSEFSSSRSLCTKPPTSTEQATTPEHSTQAGEKQSTDAQSPTPEGQSHTVASTIPEQPAQDAPNSFSQTPDQSSQQQAPYQQYTQQYNQQSYAQPQGFNQQQQAYNQQGFNQQQQAYNQQGFNQQQQPYNQAYPNYQNYAPYGYNYNPAYNRQNYYNSQAYGSPAQNPASKITGGGLGATSTNPVFVQRNWTKMDYIYSLFSLVGTAVIIYFLFIRKGGGLNTLFPAADHIVEEKDKKTFDDVKGAHEVKEEMGDLIEYLKNPGKFSALNAKLPKGVLLVGPPGCGKTLMARAVAGEADVPFYYTSGSEFEEMLVGLGAQRVRNLFKKAKENKPCIIFIDEIDAVGGRRTDLHNHSKQTLNQLLVELDGFSQNEGVIVMAATNLPDILDKALTRPGRFDRQITISLPDIKARKDIIDYYIGERGAPDVDIDALAKSTTGFSGADLFNMVNTAAIQATKLNMTKITQRLLRNAEETVIMGPERKSLTINPETKRLTAFHESGHAVVALHTTAASQIVKATLLPRGQALGFVKYDQKDELMTTKEELLARLDIAMGGRVAEELIFGTEKATQGASSDFRQATQIAQEMVARYGYSEKVGHISLTNEEIASTSPETRALIESEVKILLENSYNRAKSVLTENRHELDKLAEALLEYETLNLSEIQKVIKGDDMKEYIAERTKKEDELKRKDLDYVVNSDSTKKIYILEEDDDEEDDK